METSRMVISHFGHVEGTETKFVSAYDGPVNFVRGIISRVPSIAAPFYVNSEGVIMHILGNVSYHAHLRAWDSHEGFWMHMTHYMPYPTYDSETGYRAIDLNDFKDTIAPYLENVVVFNRNNIRVQDPVAAQVLRLKYLS